MTQMHSLRVSQPWPLLHEREDPEPRRDHQSEIERAVASKKIQARLDRNRDRVLADFALCSRPYY
jgi:hypothetical protein